MEQLTNEELNYIIESLLYGLCLEITDRWSDDDREKMLVLAKKLKTENTRLNNIDLNLLTHHEYKFAKEISSNFNINTIELDPELLID